MPDYSKKIEFDQKSGVKIQTGKLETVKKIIEAIEKDLNNPAMENYHSAAIAIQVIYNYFEHGGKFHAECEAFIKVLRNHFKETNESITH